MNLLYIKALHIVFVITWFAGLFYIVRLFIYHVEAQEKTAEEKNILQAQYKIMEKRLWYGITWPSAILTLILGPWLAFHLYNWPFDTWLLIKLLLVTALFIYHLLCGSIFRQLQKDEIHYSSMRLRVWNEVATLFLVSIVFLAVLKSTLGFIWGIAGFIVLAMLLLIAIRLYKHSRGGRSA